MIIDTSALIAIVRSEPEADELVDAIEGASTRAISAASVVEASLVLIARYGDSGDALLDRLLRTLDIDIAPVTESQTALARDAALRFGRGRHPAALNFGDCFSYALAMERNEALLFVGDDFSRTDVLIHRS
jgi:ribonuclease VapC